MDNPNKELKLMEVSRAALREAAKPGHKKCFGRGYIGTDEQDRLIFCSCVREYLIGLVKQNKGAQ
jgi:ferredoxin-thioredoxin reductase catalytic subunit